MHFSLLLLFFCFFTFGQQTISGKIFDAETNDPIPYVNISLLDSKYGASSQEDGSFLLQYSIDDIDKKLVFSALGYDKKILKLNTLLPSSQVVLKPITEVLEEIEITNNPLDDKTFLINKIEQEDLCSGYGSTEDNPWLIALYFPFSEKYRETPFLKSIIMHFGNFKNPKSKFRLRIFSIGKNGLPDKDILKENIIVELSKKQKKAIINIDEHVLVIPDEGLYVAFEWLYIDYNGKWVDYQIEKKSRKMERRMHYSPIFSATCEEDGKYKVAIYNSGKWREYAVNKFKNEEKLIPAFSLELSD